MKIRSRRTTWSLLLAGLLLTSSPVAAALVGAREAGELGFFDVAGEATGIGGSFGDPTSEPYPVAAGLVPNTVAQLGTGPSGRALASMAWPGPLAASAGSLANVIGTPLPPEVVANANYPVRAEANAGGGGRDEQTLGPMSAVVDGPQSSARTAITDFDSPGVVSAARVVTRSRSHLEGGRAITIAESELQGVEVAGLLRFETIRTVATGSTDGVEATTDQEVVVSGVTVAGEAATLGEDGLVVGGSANPNPLAPVLDGANQALESFGMTAFMTEPYSEEGAGGAARLHTGSVVVTWEPPDSGQLFLVVLGGASVRLQATQGAVFGGFEGDFGDFELGPAVDEVSASPAPPAETTGTASPTPAAPPAGQDEGGGAAPSASPRAPTPDEAALGMSPVSTVSDRVPIGWMLTGILGMGLLGMALHSFREQAIAAALAGTTCPFERSAT